MIEKARRVAETPELRISEDGHLGAGDSVMMHVNENTGARVSEEDAKGLVKSPMVQFKILSDTFDQER